MPGDENSTAPATIPAAPPSRAVSAGRGLVYITAAKLWFMVGGSAIGFVLPWLLKSTERYGEWAFILSAVSPVNNVMVTATIQTVSKFASRGPEYVEGVKRAGLRLQLIVGVLAALGFIVLAPWIASRGHGTRLVPGLRLATGVVLAYAFYSVFVGAANGAREFQKQAGLDATFTTLRAALVCGAALAFQSVLAALGGFVAAAFSVLVISVIVVGLGPVEKKASVGELAGFFLPVAFYLGIFNLLMFVDGWVIWWQVGQASGEALANASVGIYNQAQNFARIPYQAILSVTFVIFPLVSQAAFAEDKAKTRDYIDKSIRLSFLLVLAMATALAARPDGPLAFVPKDYAPAGPALATLAFGYVGYALLSIAGTILNGSGQKMATLFIGAAALVLDAGAGWVAVRWAIANGRDPLRYAAMASAAAMGMGFLLSLGWLHKSFGASLRPLTVLRAAAAAAAGLAVGRFAPLHGKLGSLAVCAAAGIVYVGVLVVTRELVPSELRRMLRPKSA